MNTSVETFVTISKVILKHELELENGKENNNNENIVRNKTQLLYLVKGVPLQAIKCLESHLIPYYPRNSLHPPPPPRQYFSQFFTITYAPSKT